MIHHKIELFNLIIETCLNRQRRVVLPITLSLDQCNSYLVELRLSITGIQAMPVIIDLIRLLQVKLRRLELVEKKICVQLKLKFNKCCRLFGRFIVRLQKSSSSVTA